MGKVKAADLPENEKFGRPTLIQNQTEEHVKTHNPMDRQAEP